MRCLKRAMSTRGATHEGRFGELHIPGRWHVGRCAYSRLQISRHHATRNQAPLRVVVVNRGRLLSSEPTSRWGCARFMTVFAFLIFQVPAVFWTEFIFLTRELKSLSLCAGKTRSGEVPPREGTTASREARLGHGNGNGKASFLLLQQLRRQLERLGRGVLAAALAAVLVLSGPAGAETVTIPVADNPALFKVQKTLVEAWMILYETYVDPNFNHLDWHGELRSELESIAHAASLEEASKEVAGMINKLGDPFTRWVPPTEYADFRVSSDGELVGGVGLLVAQDPMSGRLVVLAPIKGSPADRAGIQPGDEVVSVNGTPTSGMNGEDAAHVLRGKQGSSVTVEVARPSSNQGAGYGEIIDASSDDAVPGVAALSPTDRLDRMERKQFKLRRERVELSPVFATTVNYDDHPFGYVRLVNFSQHAAQDMEKAISQLRKDGVEGFILDLRNNPGGLVKSALEVASLWLNGEARPTIFSVQDRDTTVEDQSQAVAPFPSDLLQSTSLKSNTEPAEEAVHRVVLLGGKAITDAPLVVLVNKQSASASEILAGALHDNKRAELVGGRLSFKNVHLLICICKER